MSLDGLSSLARNIKVNLKTLERYFWMYSKRSESRKFKNVFDANVLRLLLKIY